MNLRPHHKEENIDINLTPLIDVVFLLLIFFMVSTTFDRNAKLKVNLPEASAKATRVQDDAIVLTIDAKGKYYINNRQLVNTTLQTLKLALSKTLGNKTPAAIKKQHIILRADGKTTHESVVRAMDAISQLGITRLSIATVENK